MSTLALVMVNVEKIKLAWEEHVYLDVEAIKIAPIIKHVLTTNVQILVMVKEFAVQMLNVLRKVTNLPAIVLKDSNQIQFPIKDVLEFPHIVKHRKIVLQITCASLENVIYLVATPTVAQLVRDASTASARKFVTPTTIVSPEKFAMKVEFVFLDVTLMLIALTPKFVFNQNANVRKVT